MTGPAGNSAFCFPMPKTPSFASENIEVEGKQNSLFTSGAVIKCFVIPAKSKIQKNWEEIVCLTLAGTQICRGFKEHNLITCESKGVVSRGS